jgi:hypothetical protein
MGKLRGLRTGGFHRGATRIQRGLDVRAGWWDTLFERPLLWGALAVLVCTWAVMPRLAVRAPSWEPGDVATYDVVASRDMSLPDEASTQVLRDQARSHVPAVYDREPRVRYEVQEALRELFLLCRQQLDGDGLDGETPGWNETGDLSTMLADFEPLAVEPQVASVLRASECSEALEMALLDVVSRIYQSGVVDDLRALEQRAGSGVAVRDLATGVERTYSFNELGQPVDLRTGVESVARDLLLESDTVSRRWIKELTRLLDANIHPSLTFNRAETVRRQDVAAEQVSERTQQIKRGQVIVRRGDTVSPAVVATLRRLSEEREDLRHYSSSLGVLLIVVAVVVGWRFVMAVSSQRRESSLRLVTAYVLLMLFVLLERLGAVLASSVALAGHGSMFSDVDSYLWALPHAAGPITALLLLGPQAAVLFAVSQAVLVPIMLGGDFSVMLYALTAGLVAAASAHAFKQRSVFSRAGVAVGVTNVAAMATVELYRGDLSLASVQLLGVGFAFVGGPIAAAAASGLLPAIERVLGITTDIRLLELSNQNHPLLKRLAIEAPGTFQHSLAVATLAEAGAEAIGANGLLLRVCAYYHDIGKLLKPQYYVENQRGRNPHNELSPSMSALVIMSHVKEGVSLARRSRLPLPVRESIASHHGTKLVHFFYRKAVERAKGDRAAKRGARLGAVERGETGRPSIRESDYRYPGPRPHTKELGILLLADAVEAASRTLENPTPAKIEGMIAKIVSNAAQDGQLDASELTFQDLDRVATAFLWILTNMFHHRIQYPGFDFERRGRSGHGLDRLGAKTAQGGS